MAAFTLSDRRRGAALASGRVVVTVAGRPNGIDLPSAVRQPKAG